MTNCPTCDLYRHSREPAIRAAIAKTAPIAAEAEAKFARFMAGVHERHTSLTVGRVVALMGAIGEALEGEA